MKRFSLPILAGILLLGFILRLYRFDGPIADWHSWRQADTSAVSRNFVNSGFDLLHPRFDDLSNVPSTIDNPNGYRFVEFPIYNLFQAGLFKLFGYFTLEEWGRLVSIFSSLLAAFFIYLLVRKYTDDIVALASTFFYVVLPYNIYFGRTILPDSMMVMAILGGTYFFDKFIGYSKEKLNSRAFFYLVVSFVFTTSSLLLKPYAIFFTLPMIAIAYTAYGKNIIKKWYLWIFFVLSILPLVAWRLWMLQYPEGIPQSGWLLNGGNIRFTGAFFYWIFAQRIGGLILGFWGATFFILGLLFNSRTEKILNFKNGQQLLFWSFLASSLLYVTVIARGNVQHDYYQILIIPSIVIFAGLGTRFLLYPPKEYINRHVALIVTFICIVFAFAFRWYVVRDFFNINNPSIVVAGAAVDRLVPKDAKVLANLDGDTSFLYQTKRKGWASYEKDLPGMVALGADYLVLANPTPSDFIFAKDYKIVEKTPQYVIFDLHKTE